jgi:hypothetical protein
VLWDCSVNLRMAKHAALSAVVNAPGQAGKLASGVGTPRLPEGPARTSRRRRAGGAGEATSGPWSRPAVGISSSDGSSVTAGAYGYFGVFGWFGTCGGWGAWARRCGSHRGAGVIARGGLLAGRGVLAGAEFLVRRGWRSCGGCGTPRGCGGLTGEVACEAGRDAEVLRVRSPGEGPHGRSPS